MIDPKTIWSDFENENGLRHIVPNQDMIKDVRRTLCPTNDLGPKHNVLSSERSVCSGVQLFAE
jgi:hypothetical protein